MSLRLGLDLDGCVDVISASTAKALLLLRDPPSSSTQQHAGSRGIGVASSLEEAIEVLVRLAEIQVNPANRGDCYHAAGYVLLEKLRSSDAAVAFFNFASECYGVPFGKA